MLNKVISLAIYIDKLNYYEFEIINMVEFYF
jgi:hypothetical protein